MDREEKRIQRIENEVELLKEMIDSLMKEFARFNSLANQINDVVNEANKAIESLNNTRG